MTEVARNALCAPSLSAHTYDVFTEDIDIKMTYDPIPGIKPASIAPLTPPSGDSDDPLESHAVAASGSIFGQALISRALRNRVDYIDTDSCDAGGEDSFFVADIGEVYRQHVRWKLNLPRVEPFYAVKCNPDMKVLRLLARLGTGFDCASKKEMELVMGLGVSPSRIVYAHPCKAASFVRYAAERDVKKMTFDNAEELYKVKRYFPDAQLLLRIVTDDTGALCQFSMKYGAPLQSVESLLRLAKELELNVIGVSFHVGSGASGGDAFVDAVRNASKVFDQAASLGMTLSTLDVGGGFSDDNFEDIASVLGPAIDAYFPPSVRVIAEPGRYYVASAFTLASHVIARREVPQLNNIMLYLNDGVYGNMNCILFDHQHPVVRVLTHGSRFMYGQPDNCSGPVTASVWGPTCDGIDCVTNECHLPYALEVGDWVYFEKFGAYTMSAATGFNGFNSQCDVIYVCSESGAASLLEEC
ncbi:pyridoxal-dependent decarboxylase [Myxozyma melibiosi]|uniref:ornithine decarboxylase n=1 Tax=Myxozyma melibiosi TaxID=54550 RepID=A0ABR1F059_9ASCO